MPRALPFPAFVKLANLALELFLLALKIAPIGEFQLARSRKALRERLLVGESGLREKPDQSPNKNTGQIQLAGRHIHTR